MATSRWDCPIRIAWRRGVASPLLRSNNYEWQRVRKRDDVIELTYMESFIPYFHQEDDVLPLNGSEYFIRLWSVKLASVKRVTRSTWGSFQDVESILLGRAISFPTVGDDEEDCEVTLWRLGGTSSSVGVGGVGVRLSCFKMAIGATCSASRWMNP